MLRWLTRLAIGALIIALLIWLWSRYNEDLEEEEFEEEIPLEFEVSVEAPAGLSPPEMAESIRATGRAAAAGACTCNQIRKGLCHEMLVDFPAFAGPAGRAALAQEAMPVVVDANGDGVYSADELRVIWVDLSDDDIKIIDVDVDGSITDEELRTAWDTMDVLKDNVHGEAEEKKDDAANSGG